MSYTSSFDKDISNYTISELFTILDIDIETTSITEITQKTNNYINQYKKSDPTLSTFFQEVQSELLNYLSTTESNSDYEYSKSTEQTNNWLTNQNLSQSDTNQNNKITDRSQKIDVYKNSQLPMKQQQIGINNNFNVPVSQDSLNPNLKNITTRFINLDSQFRQVSNNVKDDLSTDYILDLSEPLNNVLSMRLYSYSIPYTWYVIDYTYGNTCFWITENNISISINIPPGNYNSVEFVNELNDSFDINGFTFTDTPPVTYNKNNGKITLNLYGINYKDPKNPMNYFTVNETTVITFFDITCELQCVSKCSNMSFCINQTLGWLMGFRYSSILVDPQGNTSEGVLDLNGPKYLIIIIDDYNQNHINNGLVGIAEYSKSLKLPNYYSADLPFTCTKASSINNTDVNTNLNIGELLLDKYGNTRNNYKKVIPSEPRKLTQSQTYTINEILKNNEQNSNFRIKAPTNTDVFAIIPIKISEKSTGNLFVEFAGALQDNKRTYFGPVNVDRMHVKLLDDKGNTLNLNGADWCFTVICENLYQY